MYQIDNSTAAATQPSSTAPGSAGFFTDGNPATGLAATILPAEWLNAVMLELANVVTSAGLTLNKAAFNQLLLAIKAIGRQSVILADTGAVNAYAAANSTPLVSGVSGTLVHGVRQSVQIANANTGASTYAPDGLAAKPIYGLNLSPLQGGELPAGGIANMIYVVNAAINSGNGAWILLECTGGALQVAPATQPQHAVQLGQVGHGQCRLSVTDATHLKLSPFNGNNLIINGVPQQIPGAGVTITNASLAASTLYYVYAYMNAGSIALELSATGHTTGTTGIEQKTGDATRTLVGMIRTTSASQFANSALQVFCLNWFNRQLLRGIATLLTDVNFTNNSSGELTSALRVEFIVWADNDGGLTQTNGRMSCNTSGGAVQALQCMDGAAYGNLQEMSVSGTTFSRLPFTSGTLVNGLTEGYHLSTLFGATSSGSSATLLGGANNLVQVRG